MGRIHRTGSARRRRRWPALIACTFLVMSSSVLLASPAYAASTLILGKKATPGEVQPGESFTYTLTPQCSGLTDGCIDAVLTDVLPPEVEVTSLPPSDASKTVAFNAGTRTLTVTFKTPLPPPSPPGSVGMTAGSSSILTLGVKVPDDSQVLDGTVVNNTANLSATGIPTATAAAPVTVDVPVVVTPVATKSWDDGSAIAQSDKADTITLGVRNGSSSSAQVSQLIVEDTAPQVFEHMNVTGIGPVVFPAGANQVDVFACTAGSGVCSASTGPQTGPSLTLPVPAADVTGLRFVFSSSTGAVLPYDPTGGSVKIDTILRDTLRSNGDPYSPTTRDDMENCATPSAVEPTEPNPVTGSQTCAPFTVQPAQATIAMTKTYFSDTNGNYAADGQAVIGQESLVSALVAATNTSPFPVSTVTISEPSVSSPSEFSKLALSRLRVIFPAGATSAEVTINCGNNDVRTQTLTQPPATVDIAVPCTTGTAAGASVTFTGNIAPNQSGTLGIQGRLNDQVTDDDVNGDGVSNCADGTATSADDSIGSAAASACANVDVQPAFANVTGIKRAELPTILPGLPRRFDLSFKNSGTIVANNVVLADPADPTAPGNPFSQLRLASLNLPASPAATAEVWDPNVAGYVPYVASDTDLLTRSLGFRVTVPAIAAGQTYSLNAQTIVRDGVPLGATIQNCASVTSDAQSANSFCAPLITVTPISAGAAVQKSIQPATSVRPQPGLAATPFQFKFAAQNTGTLWLKRLVITDNDPDFFDAVDVTGPIRVNFPPAANNVPVQVQVEACTGACGDADYVAAPPTTSQNPALPNLGGARIAGLRFTFSTTDNSFSIRPGTNFPTTGACTGASICVTALPRAELASAPGTETPDVLSNTATGGYETTQQGGNLAPIPATTATHTFTDGTASLNFVKGADVTIPPGTPFPFTFTATNRGTGPIPDLEIVDPIPALLEFSPDDPASPYEVTYTLPTNAPAPPQVVFTPVEDGGGKVTSLRWQFPGWDLLPGAVVKITAKFTLAPGATVNDSIENRGGATGNREDLTCDTAGVPRPQTLTDEDGYGEGDYCTSAAVVTPTSGNAFRTEKWVAGDTSLGWLNSLTDQVLPIDDPACPRLDVSGQKFTRYPCVARVAPGQGFDFYLRLTNAGTNPASEVRLVDVFPALGDTGVLLSGEQRGTEWEQPPTLLGPVTLDPPGVLDAAYTKSAAPYCLDDLQTPPVACAAGSWDSGYDPAATAFRAFVGFPDELAPGASSALRFRMAAPAVPTNPEQNEIAWNSFAHSDFFTDGAQLPITEPIKTGVALVYGGLNITKEVDGDPTDEQAGPYGIQYECSVTPEVASGSPPAQPVIAASGTLQLSAGETQTIANVPARAECLVWEPDSDGLLSNAPDRANALSVAIPVDDSVDGQADVTVTNTVPPVEPTETSEPPSSSPSSPGPTTSAGGTGSTSTTGNGGGYGSGGYGNGGYNDPYAISPDLSADLSYTGVDVGLVLKVAFWLVVAGALVLWVENLTRRRYRRTH